MNAAHGLIMSWFNISAALKVSAKYKGKDNDDGISKDVFDDGSIDDKAGSLVSSRKPIGM